MRGGGVAFCNPKCSPQLSTSSSFNQYRFLCETIVCGLAPPPPHSIYSIRSQRTVNNYMFYICIFNFIITRLIGRQSSFTFQLTVATDHSQAGTTLHVLVVDASSTVRCRRVGHQKLITHLKTPWGSDFRQAFHSANWDSERSGGFLCPKRSTNSFALPIIESAYSCTKAIWKPFITPSKRIPPKSRWTLHKP